MSTKDRRPEPTLASIARGVSKAVSEKLNDYFSNTDANEWELTGKESIYLRKAIEEYLPDMSDEGLTWVLFVNRNEITISIKLRMGHPASAGRNHNAINGVSGSYFSSQRTIFVVKRKRTVFTAIKDPVLAFKELKCSDVVNPKDSMRETFQSMARCIVISQMPFRDSVDRLIELEAKIGEDTLKEIIQNVNTIQRYLIYKNGITSAFLHAHHWANNTRLQNIAKAIAEKKRCFPAGMKEYIKKNFLEEETENV